MADTDEALIREWFTAGSKKRWRTACWHRAPDDVIAALDRLVAERNTAYEQAAEIEEISALRDEWIALDGKYADERTARIDAEARAERLTVALQQIAPLVQDLADRGWIKGDAALAIVREATP